MVLRGASRRFIIPMAIALLMVALVGVLAAGCGSGTTTTTTAAPATTTTAALETTTTVAGSTATTAPAATTTAALSADLNGAGATFPQPVYVAWIGAFQSLQPGVKINYQGVGSGAGITQFTAQTLDFGASDAFMKDTEIAAAVAFLAGDGSSYITGQVLGVDGTGSSDPNLVRFDHSGLQLARPEDAAET